jgi:AcrR family transcriptional regulator
MPTRRKTAPAAPPQRDAYHHGALREALIEASESLLAERGVEGFSLREVARRSGVSPAAPAHHFGDMAGLLAEVARHAFEGLTAALEAGNRRGGDDPVARLREQGLGYVGFALKHPGRFGLMFRSGLRKDEPLTHSAHEAYLKLENGVRALLDVPADLPLDDAQWQALLAVWSTVHGVAHLLLAGQFDAALPAGGQEAFLRRTLAPMLQRQLEALRNQASARGRRAQRHGPSTAA